MVFLMLWSSARDLLLFCACCFGRRRTSGHEQRTDPMPMLCPEVAVECDNPGCRHGGCQGRLPARPSRRPLAIVADNAAATLPSGPAPMPSVFGIAAHAAQTMAAAALEPSGSRL